jgi:catechol 2,3-dioxygenase-like lactoylglutathione lyase family enzyme
MAATTTGVSIQRLGHVGILVSDLQKSKKFYEGIVGLEEHNRVPTGASDSEARMIFFGTKGGTRTTGVHHALVIGQAPNSIDVSEAIPQPQKAIQQIAFEMGSRGNFEQALAHLAAHGVSLTERTKHDRTGYDSGSDSAYFEGPDGNRVEFFLMPYSETT